MPYLFGFILEPSEIAYNPDLSLHYYLGQMHKQSIVFVVFSEIMQEVSGTFVSWFYIPGALIVSILCLALYRSVDFNHRLAVGAVAVVGPPGLFGYIFVLSRDFIDIALILTWLLAIRTIIKRDLNRISFLTTMVFSVLLWLNHYSFWPLFAIAVVVASILLKELHPVNILGLLFPFALYAAPARIFIASGALLSNPANRTGIMGLFANFFAGGGPPAD
jgi:hypothetical protein